MVASHKYGLNPLNVYVSQFSDIARARGINFYITVSVPCTEIVIFIHLVPHLCHIYTLISSIYTIREATQSS